jgi:hypothetical protein
MDASHSTADEADSAPTHQGSRDGSGAGDNDQPYAFGRRPTTRAPYPFTELEFARLLRMRGHTRDTWTAEDQAAA